MCEVWVSLDEVTIEDEKWSDINLSQGNITGCTFRNITLEHVDFYATMLCSSSFTNVQVMSGEFVEANMMYIQFVDSKLEDVNPELFTTLPRMWLKAT